MSQENALDPPGKQAFEAQKAKGVLPVSGAGRSKTVPQSEARNGCSKWATTLLLTLFPQGAPEDKAE